MHTCRVLVALAFLAALCVAGLAASHAMAGPPNPPLPDPYLGGVSGTVTSEATGQPVAGVAVTVTRSDGSVAATGVTNAGGRYGFTLVVGFYTLNVAGAAPIPFTIEHGDRTVVNVSL